MFRNDAMNNTDACINVFYFGANHPHDFIEKVWADQPWLAKHLGDKFSSSPSFFAFFFKIDTDNQKKLIEYINQNYKSGRY